MALSDLLYPGNPGRREKVIKLQQELVNCMEDTFDATNELIEALNTHLPCKLSPIKLNKTGTIKDNCNIFQTASKYIQDVLSNINKELSSKLEPDLYQKFQDINDSDATLIQTVRSWAVLVEGCAGLVITGLVIKLAISKLATSILSEITSLIVKIAAGVASPVAAAVLGVAIDLIVSAIMGSIERAKLESAIEELEPLVNEFKPASKKYYRSIIEIKIRLQLAGE